MSTAAFPLPRKAPLGQRLNRDIGKCTLTILSFLFTFVISKLQGVPENFQHCASPPGRQLAGIGRRPIAVDYICT